MRKIWSSVLSLCILCSFFMSNMTQVKAQSETVNLGTFIQGITVDIHTNKGLENVSLPYMYMQDKLVYCVEPLILITTGAPVVPSSKLDEATRKHLSYIASSGYNETNRKSDRWYAATQLYVWESLGYTFRLQGFDDYETYKKEIQYRVNVFETLPSFHQQKVLLKQHEKQTIVDQNNVLSLFYSVINEGKATLENKGNALSLLATSNAFQEGKVTMKKVADHDVGLPIVYQGANQVVQSVIKPFIPQNIESNFLYRVQSYGKISFTKTGEALQQVMKESTEFGDLYRLSFAKQNLVGVQANVYAKENIVDAWGNKLYAKDELVYHFVSEKQSVESGLLPAGKYYVKEIAALDGYVLDQKTYDVEIASNKEKVEVNPVQVHNERSKVAIELTKSWEEGSLLDVSDAYKDTKFGIYTAHEIYAYDKTLLAPKDSLISVSGVNAEGKLSEKIDLPLGNYYVKELQSNKHYLLDEQAYPFEVKANGEEVIKVKIGEGKIENKLRRHQLVVNKIDHKNNEPLVAQFRLLDANQNEVSNFTTNEEGQFVVEGLVQGTYYLEETKAPEGYHLDQKQYPIEVYDDQEITIKNQKVVVNASIQTNDGGSHKPFELSMLGSMCCMYMLLFRKLRKM